MLAKIIPELYTLFSSDQGYRLYDDVKPLFQMIREKNSGSSVGNPWQWERTVCGVITNLDERAYDVLNSLGLSVARPSSLGAGTAEHDGGAVVDPDLSFIVTGSEVGAHKPDSRLWNAADRWLASSTTGEATEGPRRLALPQGFRSYTRLHVGDGVKTDVLGARRACWQGVLLDREGKYTDQLNGQDAGTVGVLAENKTPWPVLDKVEVIRDLKALQNWSPSPDQLRIRRVFTAPKSPVAA